MSRAAGLAAATPLVARTVLDLRAASDKYVSQTLLLAAGWHRHAAADAALEVHTIGGREPAVDALLREIGAGVDVMPPGRNDDFSPSSNKIEAAGADARGRRVLLLDNDVVILGPLAGLAALPADAIAAAVPGVVRVRDAQWASIADGLGLPLLRRRWTPLNPRDDTDTADDTSSCAAAPERWLYLNSGVVLFPAGLDHRATWLDHQRRIRDHFAAHPLGAGPVTSSDQAAFATSIAAHGRFAWLPLRFNYRFGAFRLGLETAERIAIVHCTGHVDDAGLAVSARMDAYWEKHVWPRLARLSPAVADDEKARRRDIAATVLAATRALARDYDLDARLAAYRRRRG